MYMDVKVKAQGNFPLYYQRKIDFNLNKETIFVFRNA